jgi:hypothetical protein
VNTATINRSRAQVWRTLIPELGKTFFVINNLDQGSGLVNISYSGDPERFVDCGVITMGENHFPAASARETFEAVQPGEIVSRTVVRTMALEGRANIVLEEASWTATRVTVNTRYVLTKTLAVLGTSHSTTETIAFSFGDRTAFSAGTTCRSTGALEGQILQLAGKTQP